MIRENNEIWLIVEFKRRGSNNIILYYLKYTALFVYSYINAVILKVYLPVINLKKIKKRFRCGIFLVFSIHIYSWKIFYYVDALSVYAQCTIRIKSRRRLLVKKYRTIIKFTVNESLIYLYIVLSEISPPLVWVSTKLYISG